MLNVYSRARDGETLLSRSFRAKEFACKDGTDPLFVDSELVQVLQAIRDHFGAPVVITSGYRTDQNASRHAEGRAADINCWHMENGGAGYCCHGRTQQCWNMTVLY